MVPLCFDREETFLLQFSIKFGKTNKKSKRLRVFCTATTNFPAVPLRSLDSCCQPLTMAQVLVGTEFTPPLTQPRPLKELGHQNVVKLFCKLALQQEFVIFALLQYFAASPKIKFKRC